MAGSVCVCVCVCVRVRVCAHAHVFLCSSVELDAVFLIHLVLLENDITYRHTGSLLKRHVILKQTGYVQTAPQYSKCTGTNSHVQNKH